MKDIDWFKRDIEPYLKGYDIKYKFYKNGDHGDLNEVEFNSKEKGGEIDFWSSGWLSVHFVNYITGDELLNVILKPEQHIEKKKLLNKLKELI